MQGQSSQCDTVCMAEILFGCISLYFMYSTVFKYWNKSICDTRVLFLEVYSVDLDKTLSDLCVHCLLVFWPDI